MRLREWDPANPHIEADLDRLYALDQVCFHPGVAYTRAELRAFLAHPSAFSVLLEEVSGSRPDEPAALLGFSIGRTLRSRGRPMFHIITIDVDPGARRRGIGSRLMDWMVARGQALKVHALRLEVAVDNEDALSFYGKLGFEEVGRIPGYYLGKTDALVLERAVARAGPRRLAFW